MRSELFASGMVGPSGHAFSVHSSKACRVHLAGDVLAKGGSMVAYDGFVTFAWERPNVVSGLSSQYPSDGVLFMRCSGQGDLFLADGARDVHLVYLEGEQLTLNLASVLAFEATTTWSIARLEPPPGVGAKGMWNVVLSGTGWVALTSVGPPIVMAVTPQSRVFVDPDAVIGWSSHLRLTYEQSVVLTSAWTPPAGAGGEDEQLRVEGAQGYVFVQPSERGGRRRKKR